METPEPATTHRSRWRLTTALVLLALVALLFANNNQILASRFAAATSDGFNGSMWGGGSRAMRTNGLIESRFGGRTDTREYANHPPGVLAETYLSESVFGEHRWSTRLPAVLSSIAALVLLTLMLREMDLHPIAVIGGVVMAGASEMFLTFAAMIDTPVTSFPISIAIVWTALRVAKGESPPSWLPIALGAAAGLSGWQSTTFAGIAALWLIGTGWRRPPERRTGLLLGLGAAIGVLVSLSWMAWVYGGLSRGIERAGERSSGIPFRMAIEQQVDFLVDLAPVALVVGLIGLAMGVLDAKRRNAVVLTLTPVVLYGFVFREGAFGHDYWSFAGVATGAVGVGIVIDRLARKREMLAIGAVVLLAAASILIPSDNRVSRDHAVTMTPLLDHLDENRPESGPVIAAFLPAKSPPFEYELGSEPLWVFAENPLHEVALEHPEVPILLDERQLLPELVERLREEAVAEAGTYMLVRLADAARIDADFSDGDGRD